MQYFCDGNGSLTLPNKINYWNNQPWDTVINCNLHDLNFSSPLTEIEIIIQLNPGQWIKNFQIDPVGLRSPTNVSLDIGDNGNVDWHEHGNLFHHTSVGNLSIDGVSLSPNLLLRGFVASASNSVSFEVVMPQTYDVNNFISWSQTIEYSGDFQEHYTLTNHSLTVDGIVHNLVKIAFEYTTNSYNTFKLIEVDLLSHGNLRFSLDKSYVQSMMKENPEGGSVIPVSISSQRGSVLFDGIIEHDLAIIDKWISLPQQTFVPGTSHQAISQHSTLSFTSDIEFIELWITSTFDESGEILAHIEIDNLDQGGRFIQHYGAGTISIDSSKSSWDGENVTWVVNPHWYLDDYSRLYWKVKATNTDGLSLGPDVESTGSGTYSASTNDAEVIGFKVLDDTRDLSDFSDPLWPFKVKGSTNLDISGQVRYSGLEGIYPSPSDIDVVISLVNSNVTLASLDVNIDDQGLFSGTITTPNSNQYSGEEMTVRVDIIRIGPSIVETTIDVTSENHKVDFILDINDGNVLDLWVVAPGGDQPADGHVWHPGQDLPLRLSISDDNGLPAIMDMHYLTGDNDWNSITFQVPIGQKNATIDLPLISYTNMQFNNQVNGLAKVYITGKDLAGNNFSGGGNSSEPLATIYLQERLETYVNPNTLQLNREGDYLLPGNTHRFTFEISDGNGIESIDKIQFGLTENDCDLTWKPWNSEISHDSSCFIRSPRIDLTQVGNEQTWWVNIDFELRWDLYENQYDINLQIPWLHIFDESTRTGAGFNSMIPFSWKYHTGVELQIDSITDINFPTGKMIDDVIYIHAQDIVDIEMQLYHSELMIPANNFPFSAGIDLELIGVNDEQQYFERINNDGSVKLRIVYDEIRFGSQARLQAEIANLDGHSKEGDVVQIVIDDSDPVISVDMSSLIDLESDSMDQVRIDVTVHDLHGLTNDSITMNYVYTRKGRIVEGTDGQKEIEIEFNGDNYNLYSSQVDISLAPGDLEKDDGILIWFTGADASGRGLTGLGSSSSNPLVLSIKWMEYEPVLQQIVSNPYRPKVGDIIEINLAIVNIGEYSGNSTVIIRDSEGVVHGNESITLSPDEMKSLNFEVEAWTSGNLGLEIIIDDNYAVPVPIAEIELSDTKSSILDDKMLGVALLSVFFSAFILAVVRNRQQKNFDFHEEE